MTPEHTPRSQDQSIQQPCHQLVQIGPRHGYRIEGDHAFINAEIQVPPYHPGGEWTLELWATKEPYREGPLTGVKVAHLALDLPTPIGQYVHQVDTRTAARLPLQGQAHAMVLALVEHGQDGQSSVNSFANYAETQTFSAPHLMGNVGYSVRGQEVVLEADGIFNPRSVDNLSGTLSLELWAFPLPGTPAEGLRLAACEIEQVAGQSQLAAIEQRVAFSEPPVGRFQLAMLLCEWTLAQGYVARDRRDFRCLYERSAPEVTASSPAVPAVSAAVNAAVTVPARPIERLRLVPTVPPPPAVEAAAPEARTQPDVAAPDRSVPTPAAKGLVSIQTGSVEELARVKGLTPKLAKEIVKARPFSSVADLIRVRGLGQKTIEKLKGLVTL